MIIIEIFRKIHQCLVTSHDFDNFRRSWFTDFLHLLYCKVAFAVISLWDDTLSPRCLTKMISSLHNESFYIGVPSAFTALTVIL